jgi:hypothetical protein
MLLLRALSLAGKSASQHASVLLELSANTQSMKVKSKDIPQHAGPA